MEDTGSDAQSSDRRLELIESAKNHYHFVSASEKLPENVNIDGRRYKIVHTKENASEWPFGVILPNLKAHSESEPFPVKKAEENVIANIKLNSDNINLYESCKKHLPSRLKKSYRQAKTSGLGRGDFVIENAWVSGESVTFVSNKEKRTLSLSGQASSSDLQPMDEPMDEYLSGQASSSDPQPDEPEPMEGDGALPLSRNARGKSPAANGLARRVRPRAAHEKASHQ